MHRVLGTTGIGTGPIILGCGTFGGIGGARDLIGRGMSRDAALAAMDEAAALGITVFDTAERYAGGESELAIGAWLRTRPDAVTGPIHIATKVAPPSTDGDPDPAFDQTYIERKLAVSLERLGVDHVTFYLSHAPDPDTPIEATVEGFAATVASGRVGHLGCCNVDRHQLEAALDAADRMGVPGFEWVQNGYSLLSPGADRDLRALCRERGLGYTPFSPLAGGVLTGKYRRGEPFAEGTRMALRPEGHADLLTSRVHDALDQLRAAAANRQVSCAGLALAWVVGHADVTAAVAGPRRTAPHLGHVAETLAIELSDDEHTGMASWFDDADRGDDRP